MYKALVFKELRETIAIAVIALLAYLAWIVNLTGYDIMPFGPQSKFENIPFVNDPYLAWFIFVSVIFSTALGLWQSVDESYRGTWSFLLHHPMRRSRLIGVKMAAGVGIYLFVSALGILVYAVWAATPGTHSSPFYCWMTVEYWMVWILVLVCYLGAFLSGIRPGRWIGTRLLPVPVAFVIVFGISAIYVFAGWFCGFVTFTLICALFISLILFVARGRDFS